MPRPTTYHFSPSCEVFEREKGRVCHCFGVEGTCMNVWTCPNLKCRYDKELQSGQSCPLCGEQAKEFKLSEVDDLLKQKWEFRKSITEAERQKKLLKSVKFCPKCGSTNVNFPVFYRPSVWRCSDCGYEGAFIVEDSKLAEKLHERYSRDRIEKSTHED